MSSPRLMSFIGPCLILIGVIKGSKFFDEYIDNRLPAMERIVDIEDGGAYKIYPFKEIRKKKVINDDFKGKKTVIFYAGKTVSVLDEKDIKDSKHVGTVTFSAQLLMGDDYFLGIKRGCISMRIPD